MFTKFLLPLLIFLLLPILANAQEVIPMKEVEKDKVYYLHNGKFIPKEKADNYKIPTHRDNLNRNIFGDIYDNPLDLADTLGYRDAFSAPPNSNFGFFGQDRMIQWFVAPADMRIISVGMMCVAKDDTTTAASVKLVNFAWTLDQIKNQVPFPTYLGYYQAAGNGYNDATAYLDDPDITGGWVNNTGLGLTSPFGNDLWSDAGEGYPFVPVVDAAAVNYNWVDMDILFEPEVYSFRYNWYFNKKFRSNTGYPRPAQSLKSYWLVCR